MTDLSHRAEGEFASQRRQDIPLLVNYFVSKLSRTMRKQIKSILAEVRRANRRIPRFLAGPQRKCSVCKGGAQKRRVV